MPPLQNVPTGTSAIICRSTAIAQGSVDGIDRLGDSCRRTRWAVRCGVPERRRVAAGPGVSRSSM